MLTPVHRHSQPPDEGETSVNVHSKAKLEDTSNAPLVSLQVKTKSSLLPQYKKSFVVKMPMLLNGLRGIKCCLNPLFSADLSNIPYAESSINETEKVTIIGHILSVKKCFLLTTVSEGITLLSKKESRKI